MRGGAAPRNLATNHRRMGNIQEGKQGAPKAFYLSVAAGSRPFTREPLPVRLWSSRQHFRKPKKMRSTR